MTITALDFYQRRPSRCAPATSGVMQQPHIRMEPQGFVAPVQHEIEWSLTISSISVRCASWFTPGSTTVSHVRVGDWLRDANGATLLFIIFSFQHFLLLFTFPDASRQQPCALPPSSRVPWTTTTPPHDHEGKKPYNETRFHNPQSCS